MIALRTVAASSRRLESASARVAVGEFDFSWAFWCFAVTMPGPVPRVSGARDPSGTGGWEVGFDGTNWFASAYGPSGEGRVYTSESLSPLNTWRFVIFWRTVSPNRLQLQVDNETVFNSDGGGSSIPMPGAVAAGSSPLHVGNIGSWGSRHWDGRIGPVARWSRVLTAEERGWLWNAGRGVPYEGLPPSLLNGLVAWWPLDEAGGVRRDVHGDNNLTPVNGPGWEAGHVPSGVAHEADDAAGVATLLLRMLEG